MEVESIPRWLEVLLEEKFFKPCFLHEIVRKNDKNVLCLDCCVSVCSHCLSPHHSHRLLQIRRYVYHDVIRVEDAVNLMDCTSVQSYTNNGAKVIFIHQRPKNRPFKATGNLCLTCDRCLQPPNQFCSLSCKVMHLLKTEGGVSNHVLECNFSGSIELEDGQMTPDSVLEPEAQTSSGSSDGWFSFPAVSSEIVRKKRSNLNPVRTGSGSPSSSTSMNRRKKKSSTPHRSPLC